MMKNSTIITMTPDGIVGLSKHNIAKGMGTWTRNVCITKMIKHKFKKRMEQKSDYIKRFRRSTLASKSDYIS